MNNFMFCWDASTLQSLECVTSAARLSGRFSHSILSITLPSLFPSPLFIGTLLFGSPNIRGLPVAALEHKWTAPCTLLLGSHARGWWHSWHMVHGAFINSLQIPHKHILHKWTCGERVVFVRGHEKSCHHRNIQLRCNNFSFSFSPN